MGEAVTLAFNRKTQSTEEKVTQLKLLTERVFSEVYNKNIGEFISALRYECRNANDVVYKRWLQQKLKAHVVQKPL